MKITVGGGSVRATPGGSLLFTRAALRFAARAASLDDLEHWKTRDESARRELEDELTETSLAAVTTAYASVEAAMNELYLERAEFDQAAWFPGLSDKLATGFTFAWFEDEKPGELTSVEKLNPLKKAKLALSIAGAQNFTWGSGAAQSLGFLQDLRNALLHHKPFTVERSAADDSPDPLERVLRTQFDRASIWNGRNPAFRWTGCLGGGCARWAAATAVNFQRDFFGALGCSYPSKSLQVTK